MVSKSSVNVRAASTTLIPAAQSYSGTAASSPGGRQVQDKGQVPGNAVAPTLQAVVTKAVPGRLPSIPSQSLARTIAPVSNLPAQPVLDLLSPQERDELLRISTGGAGLAAEVALQSLMNSPGFTQLPSSVQAKALQTFLALAPTSPDAAGEIGSLLNAPADRLLSPEQQCAMLDVFRVAGSSGRENLLELVKRTGTETIWLHGTAVRQDTTPLLDKDSMGRTLLDCLAGAAQDATGTLTKSNRAAYGTLTSLLAEAARPCMQYVGTGERGKLRDIASGVMGDALKDAYAQIVTSENFQKLAPQEQGEVLFALLRTTQPDHREPTDKPGSAASLAALVDSAAFVEHSHDLLTVFNATSPEFRAELALLSNRPLDQGLLNRDSKGGTLLNSLVQLATGPLEPQLAKEIVTRDSLLGSILQEITEPGQINQGGRGTCTVTSMQYMLCTENPAEYARIMAGLLSPAGRVELANGDTLTRVSDSIPFDDNPTRSSSERIFQCAMMDYGDNAGLHDDYDNTDPDDIHRGLTPIEQRHALEGLFGRDFHLWGLRGGDVYRDTFDVLKDCMPNPTLVDLHWSDSNGNDAGHAVVVTRIENGRVYIRNPWGATDEPAGTQYDNPPRMMEDPVNRIESMTIEDFRAALKNVYEAD